MLILLFCLENFNVASVGGMVQQELYISKVDSYQAEIDICVKNSRFAFTPKDAIYLEEK